MVFSELRQLSKFLNNTSGAKQTDLNKLNRSFLQLYLARLINFKSCLVAVIVQKYQIMGQFCWLLCIKTGISGPTVVGNAY